MCGIGGIVRVWAAGAVPPLPDVAIPERWLDVIDESIKHRGPDGQGRFRDRVLRADGSTVDVAFVHRRLSIIDHSGGHQPMVSEAPAPNTQTKFGTARVAVVFNGCIYNHRDLRRELVAAGHQFVTDHSDTEVLIHGWRQWGPAMFERLDGMYAVVVWDAALGACISARDRFGEKPLYVVDHRSHLAFGSTIGGAVAINAAMSRSDGGTCVWGDALAGWVRFGWNQALPFGSDSISLPGISRWLVDPIQDIDSGHTGWHPAVLNHETRPATAEHFNLALHDAVRSRMESDVPVGCFLSGGIDSALITRFAHESDSRTRAFTVRMPSPEFDESRDAAETARTIGVPHTILDCSTSPAEDLVCLIEQLGLPFGDSSLLPSYWVSKAARSYVKVALGGDGGDELFMGYDRHRILRMLSLFERLPPDSLDTLSAFVKPGTGRSTIRTKLDRLLHAARFDGYRELLGIFSWPQSWDLGLAPTGEHGIKALLHFGLTLKATSGDWDIWLRAIRRFDAAFYLPEDLLRKSDSASMAVALELRSPFLAPSVAQPALSAPLRTLMPHGQRKGLLRQLARNYLPAHIVDRPKRGFAIPVGEWFRSDFGSMKTLLMDMLHSADPYPADLLGLEINRRFVDQMIDEHMTQKRDHSQRLYMMLVLAIWARWLQRTLRQPT